MKNLIDDSPDSGVLKLATVKSTVYQSVEFLFVRVNLLRMLPLFEVYILIRLYGLKY